MPVMLSQVPQLFNLPLEQVESNGDAGSLPIGYVFITVKDPVFNLDTGALIDGELTLLKVTPLG